VDGHLVLHHQILKGPVNAFKVIVLTRLIHNILKAGVVHRVLEPRVVQQVTAFDDFFIFYLSHILKARVV